MKFSYENQGTSTYFVVQLPESAEIDTMTMGMITNNEIRGVAPAIFTQLDDTKFVKYNISAKVSLSQLFETPVNKNKLIGVFSGVCDALQSAEEYMLEYNTFLYDVDKIFVNVSTLEVSLICVPVVSVEQNTSTVNMLFKNIMFSSQFDTTENNDYVGKIINYLNGVGAFSIIDFKEMLNSLKSGSVTQNVVPQVNVAPQVGVAPVSVEMPKTVVEAPAVSAQPVYVEPPKPVVQPTLTIPQPMTKPDVSAIPVLPGISGGKPDKKEKDKKGFSLFGSKAPKEKKKEEKKHANIPVSGMAIPGTQGASMAMPPVVEKKAVKVQQPVQQPVQLQVPQQPVVHNITNFGETTVLGGSMIGETTVLGVNPVATNQPYLVRSKNNERIPINKPVFRIGKEKSYVDYFIGDNSAISRSHANIIQKGNDYFLVDTNSTNHTYLGGEMLQSNVEKQLAHGSKIQLANEEFEFRMI